MTSLKRNVSVNVVANNNWSCSLISAPKVHWTVQPTADRRSRFKKPLRGDANTARVAKNFRPAADPFPGALNGQNLISWRWSQIPLPTNSVWWGSMHAISSYRGNIPTHPETHTHTHTHKQTGPITIHCAAASAQCNKMHGPCAHCTCLSTMPLWELSANARIGTMAT